MADDPYWIYNKLRYAHQSVKDITSDKRYASLDDFTKNAIEGVSSTLYMAEHIVSRDQE